MLQRSWEAVFTKEVQLTPSRVPQSQKEDVTESPVRVVEDNLGDRRIVGEAKDAEKRLVDPELATLLEELLVDIFCSSYHSAENGIRLEVYSVLKRFILNLLHKDVIGKTLYAQVAKLFDTNADVDWL